MDWATIPLDVETTVQRASALQLLQLPHLVTLGRPLVLHVHRVVTEAASAALAEFVLLAHTFKLLVFSSILVLHVFPALYVSLHLLRSPVLYLLLLHDPLLLTLLSVVGCKVLLVSIHGPTHEVRGLGIRCIHTSMVDEFVVGLDVLTISLILCVGCLVGVTSLVYTCIVVVSVSCSSLQLNNGKQH